MAITTPFDAEESGLQSQLAMAEALRKQGMSQDMGQGYRGGKVFIVGNPLNNVVSALGGAFLGNQAREGLGQIEQRRNEDFNTFMGARPSIYNEIETPTEQSGPVQEGEAPLPMVPVKTKALKSAAQILEDQQKWIADSAQNQNPLVQSIRKEAMMKGFDWPEKMLASEQAQALARERMAEDAARREREFAATQDYRNATLGIQRDRLDMQRDRAAEPTAAQLKRQDALEAKEQAQGRAGTLLDQMETSVDLLDKKGGIPSSGRGALANSLSSLRNSTVGQLAGSTFGTKEQAARNDIDSIATSLLTELKSLKGLGASQMNSNFELQRYLLAIKGGKNYDAETMRNVITRARELFGAAKSANAPAGGAMPPGVTVVRTGTRNGKRVVQGSDGKVYDAE